MSLKEICELVILRLDANSRVFNKHGENGATGKAKPDRFLTTLHSCSTFHCYFKKKIIGLQEIS